MSTPFSIVRRFELNARAIRYLLTVTEHVIMSDKTCCEIVLQLIDEAGGIVSALVNEYRTPWKFDYYYQL